VSNIVRVALDAPAAADPVNAGLEVASSRRKVRNLPIVHGLNAATGEYVDMLSAHPGPDEGRPLGAADAASIAALFLTT